MKKIFKNYLEQIINAADQEDAIENVFYGPEGIDMAFQHEKITWEEHQLLLKLINKMA